MDAMDGRTEREQALHLFFINSLTASTANCEAMVWSTTGTPIQGITGGNGGDRHVDVLLTQSAATQGEHKEIYIEVACNGMFGNGDGKHFNLLLSLTLCNSYLRSHSTPTLSPSIRKV